MRIISRSCNLRHPIDSGLLTFGMLVQRNISGTLPNDTSDRTDRYYESTVGRDLAEHCGKAYPVSATAAICPGNHREPEVRVIFRLVDGMVWEGGVFEVVGCVRAAASSLVCLLGFGEKTDREWHTVWVWASARETRMTSAISAIDFIIFCMCEAIEVLKSYWTQNARVALYIYTAFTLNLEIFVAHTCPYAFPRLSLPRKNPRVISRALYLQDIVAGHRYRIVLALHNLVASRNSLWTDWVEGPNG